jgi:glycosyltransferase involved in cell wall biosynthesis
MVATASLEKELRAHEFQNLVHWSRGVDTTLFKPYGKSIAAYDTLPRPVLLYVGRLAVEKNIRAFLDLETTGSKVVIGDGPDREALQRDYPDAHFLGKLEGETLARHYAAADLFVFPSTTDTFGLVLLEACAAGLRIAAYPAPGSLDIFANPQCQNFATLDANLQHAVDKALLLPDAPQAPRVFAQTFSWQACARQFLDHLQSDLQIQTPHPCEKEIEKAI